MLDPPVKRLLARFSVFARGAGLEQAEAVCGPADEIGTDVLTGLEELADQSLIRRMPDFDEPRLLMLQTIREFAAERLQESDDAEVIHDRHAEAYAAMAEEAERRLFGGERKAQLDRLERDLDNFRAALDWCISHQRTELGLRLGADARPPARGAREDRGRARAPRRGQPSGCSPARARGRRRHRLLAGRYARSAGLV